MSYQVATNLGNKVMGINSEETKKVDAMADLAKSIKLPNDLLLGPSGSKESQQLLKLAKIGTMALKLAKQKAIQRAAFVHKLQEEAHAGNQLADSMQRFVPQPQAIPGVTGVSPLTMAGLAGSPFPSNSPYASLILGETSAVSFTDPSSILAGKKDKPASLELTDNIANTNADIATTNADIATTNADVLSQANILDQLHQPNHDSPIVTNALNTLASLQLPNVAHPANGNPAASGDSARLIEMITLQRLAAKYPEVASMHPVTEEQKRRAFNNQVASAVESEASGSLCGEGASGMECALRNRIHGEQQTLERLGHKQDFFRPENQKLLSRYAAVNKLHKSDAGDEGSQRSSADASDLTSSPEKQKKNHYQLTMEQQQQRDMKTTPGSVTIELDNQERQPLEQQTAVAAADAAPTSRHAFDGSDIVEQPFHIHRQNAGKKTEVRE